MTGSVEGRSNTKVNRGRAGKQLLRDEKEKEEEKEEEEAKEGKEGMEEGGRTSTQKLLSLFTMNLSSLLLIFSH